MPAPEVSAFGDGSHAPGATGLTIDGGGFGAFPGSVWIYENADLTGDADELTVNAWNDLEIGVDIPASLNNAAGTRYLFVQREDLAWSNAFEFTLEASGVTLTVQDATHGHAVDSVALTQAHVLAVDDAAHGHGVDNPTLVAGLSLVVADALHAHTADNLALVQAHVLAVQDALHGHTAEAPTLILGVSLEVADGLHGHTSDAVVLRIPGKIPPPSRVLIVEGPGSARRIAA